MRKDRLIIIFLFYFSTAFCIAGKYHPAIQYLFPIPGSEYVSVKTTIILKFHPNYRSQVLDAGSLIMVSDRNGIVPGTCFLSPDGKTIIFRPENDLSKSDSVKVQISMEQLNMTGFEYHFRTSNIDPFTLKKGKSLQTENISSHSNMKNEELRVINGVAVPSDFPEIAVWQTGETSPGLIFYATNFPSWSGNYFIILENDGTPYYYKREYRTHRSGNLTVQPTGALTAFIYDSAFYTVMDKSFTEIDKFRCGHGYETDNHELVILENGHALIIGEEDIAFDLRDVVEGGRSNATLQGNHFQELDRDKNVVFEFRSWDYFNVKDALGENLRGGYIDYVHMNSVAIDFDSNYVISSRHLSEITKIDRKTGEIIWRLGGVHNQYIFPNDDWEISYQHDARPVEGKPNSYTLFDNGNKRDPNYSRAVEYALDTIDMIAYKTWEYRYTPDVAVGSMGSVQRFNNGNTLIDWPRGKLHICEVNASNEIVFELLSEGHSNYRCRRYDWYGKMDQPYIQLENQGAFVRLFFNKFGDSGVKYYKIYAGTDPIPETVIDSTNQTWYDAYNLPNFSRYYFRVSAVDSSGSESDFSHAVNTWVNYVPPGLNQIINGDFNSSASWLFETEEAGLAQAETTNGELLITLNSPNPENTNIILYQENLLLLEGKEYTLSFEASSIPEGLIEPRLENVNLFYTDYSKIGMVYLTSRKTVYSYTFTIEESSTTDARLAFYCNRMAGQIFLDNVSLTYDDSTYVDPSGYFARINFQPKGVTPEGYLPDIGEMYQSHTNGFVYGWLNSTNDVARLRDNNNDMRYATLNHFQKNGDARTWEFALPNGNYSLEMVFGDPAFTDQVNNMMVEDIILTDPDGYDHFDEFMTDSINISDGDLTISPAPGALNAKICFIHIIQNSLKPTQITLPQKDVVFDFTSATANGSVFLYFNHLNIDAKLNIKVFDILGHKKMELPFKPDPGTLQQLEFSTVGWKSGIYFGCVYYIGGMKNFRFVVE